MPKNVFALSDGRRGGNWVGFFSNSSHLILIYLSAIMFCFMVSNLSSLCFISPFLKCWHDLNMFVTRWLSWWEPCCVFFILKTWIGPYILYNNIFVHLFFLYHNLHFMIINLCINAFVYLSLKKYKQTNNPSLTCRPPAPSLSLAFPLEPNFLKEKSTVGISTSLLPFSIYPSLTSSSPF